MQQFDVVISGGAASGSILALALSCFSAHKLRIAIVEKSLPDSNTQGGFDARSIALAQGSLQKIAKIQPLEGENLFSQLAPLLTIIRQIEVSDQTHFGKTTLTAEELQLAQLGAVIELAPLGMLLQELLIKQPNIHLYCPHYIKQIERTQESCTLRLDNDEQLSCALVVAADGIQSQTAKMCNVLTETLQDYAQSAVIANVMISEEHQHRAFERFTSQGPLALLPLSGNRMSLVWCVKQANELLSLSEQEFLAKLQQQFGWQLGKFSQVGKRFAYPLISQRAQSHIHHRFVAVGNAAQLLHPVAGQGFNLGLRDIFLLAEKVGKAFMQGKDTGEYALLSQFEQERNQDQERVIQQTSGLISLFCCERLPIQIARNLGLIGASHCKIARQQIAHQALGI